MIEDVSNHLIEYAMLNIAWLATFTTIVVSLLKRVPQLDFIPANKLPPIIALVILAIALVADNFGYFDQFNNTFQIITNLLQVLIGGTLGSAGIYHASRAVRMPVLQYKRGDENRATRNVT